MTRVTRRSTGRHDSSDSVIHGPAWLEWLGVPRGGTAHRDVSSQPATRCFQRALDQTVLKQVKCHVSDWTRVLQQVKCRVCDWTRGIAASKCRVCDWTRGTTASEVSCLWLDQSTTASEVSCLRLDQRYCSKWSVVSVTGPWNVVSVTGPEYYSKWSVVSQTGPEVLQQVKCHVSDWTEARPRAACCPPVKPAVAPHDRGQLAGVLPVGNLSHWVTVGFPARPRLSNGGEIAVPALLSSAHSPIRYACRSATMKLRSLSQSTYNRPWPLQQRIEILTTRCARSSQHVSRLSA